jgi:hypothetical protein
VAVIELLPNEKELRALRLFVSTDETRPNLATLYAYSSEGGCTYVATDGYTEIVRRSGTHRTMALYEIRKLTPFAVSETGEVTATDRTPPGWDQVLKAGSPGKIAPAYSISPIYFARLAEVEKAAGHRAADDFAPKPGMSKKDANQKRSALKGGALALLTIPSDPLDGWFWIISTEAARWEGLIMPRRP